MHVPASSKCAPDFNCTGFPPLTRLRSRVVPFALLQSIEKKFSIVFVDFTMETGDHALYVADYDFILVSTVLRDRTDVNDVLVKVVALAFI